MRHAAHDPNHPAAAASSPDVDPQATRINMTALTYHTINHEVTYHEGDTYDLMDPLVAGSVVACGFAKPTASLPSPQKE